MRAEAFDDALPPPSAILAEERAARARRAERGRHEPAWAADDPGCMPERDSVEPSAEILEIARPLATIDVGAWERSEPPERRWVVPGWLEAGALHLFGGKGGDGKSLFLQQLGTAIAADRMWLPGFDPHRGGPVLLVNAEDDVDELHRRQKSILAAMRCPWADVAGRLHIAALVGESSDRLHLGRFNDRAFVPGSPFASIEECARRIGAVGIFLDNRAQIYPGDLNDTAQATSFCNALTGMAKRTGAAVVLATHPARAEGSEFAGAAAWENASRVRWWLERESEGSDIRRIKRGKANYAAQGVTIEFQWRAGAFEPINTAAGGLSERDASANAAFLACLRDCRRQERNATAAPGPNFAPAVFETMPAARGFTKAELRAAMERMLAAGRLVARAELPWKVRREAVFGLAEAAP